MLSESQEDYLTTGQRWGASWADLEPGITARIDEFHRENPSCPVYGIELRGPSPPFAENIDHHLYSEDRGRGFPAEDRRHPLTSIEQVASIIGVELNRFQSLVAKNDSGYIPAMLSFGASKEEIESIREADRRAQGLTESDELNAKADLTRMEKRGDRIRVRCTGRPTSAHVDGLHGLATELLLTSREQWEYYGPRFRRFFAVMEGEASWQGGTASNGYAGVQNPTPASQELLLTEFWNPAPPTE